MINKDSISDISDNVDGKLLMMALAILTSLTKEDIDNNRWGGWVHPDIAFRQVVELANKVYYEEEWKSEEIKREIRRNRDNKLNEI